VDVLGPRLARAAFDGGEQGGRFTADKRSAALVDVDVKGEIRSQNVFAQKAGFLGGGDGQGEVQHRQGIFVAHVDIPFGRADGVSADDHALENAVRIAFHQAAVHVSAGIAFVAVADDVFRRAVRPAAAFPFDAGRKSSSAPSAEPRFFHFIDHAFRRHFGQGFGQRAVAADNQIVLDPCGIDQAVLSENQPVLFFIERYFLFFQHGFFGERIAVKQLFQNLARGDGFGNDVRHVLNFDLLIKDLFRMDDHQRAFFTETEAAGGADFHVHVLFLQFRFEGFLHIDAAVSAAAGSGADRDQFLAGIEILLQVFLNAAQV